MRSFVMGDRQAAFAKVTAVLDDNAVLVGDRLAPDVHLISIGDGELREVDAADYALLPLAGCGG